MECGPCAPSCAAIPGRARAHKITEEGRSFRQLLPRVDRPMMVFSSVPLSFSFPAPPNEFLAPQAHDATTLIGLLTRVVLGVVVEMRPRHPLDLRRHARLDAAELLQ